MAATTTTWHRLAIAGMDPPRVVHIQDQATLRAPAPEDGLIEVAIGPDRAHVTLLADEAVIVVTVRQADLWALAERIVPLLGMMEGGGR
jgi:hypothetical protein